MLGRIEAENRRLLALSEEEDTLLKLRDIPGPTGLLLGSPTEEEIKAAAYKLVRYAPKARGLPRVPVRVLRKGQLPGP